MAPGPQRQDGQPSTQGAIPGARPVQPPSIDGRRGGLSRPCRSRRGTPSPRPVCVLRPRRRRRPGVRVRVGPRARGAVRVRGGRPARRAATPRLEIPAARRVDRGGRVVLGRAERCRRARRRGVLPADVPRRGLVVEPAGPAHGGDARRTARPLRPPRRPHQGGGLGAQLAHRRCPRHGDERAWRTQRRPTRTPTLWQTFRGPDRDDHLRRRGHRSNRLGSPRAAPHRSSGAARELRAPAARAGARRDDHRPVLVADRRTRAPPGCSRHRGWSERSA